jgi:hypothetical protein
MKLDNIIVGCGGSTGYNAAVLGSFSREDNFWLFLDFQNLTTEFGLSKEF